jgi:hypothetical protein
MESIKIQQNFTEIVKHKDNLDLVIYCCIEVLKKGSSSWMDVKKKIVKTSLLTVSEFTDTMYTQYSTITNFANNIPKLNQIKDDMDRNQTVI